MLEMSKPLKILYKALEWIVARAQIEWEDLQEAPRPPLKLAIAFQDFRLELRFNKQNIRRTENASNEDDSAPTFSAPG